MDLAPGSIVACRDGKAGRLHAIVVDPCSNTVTSLIVAGSGLWKQCRVVPVAWLKASTSDRIVLDASRADFERLPQYRELTCACPDLSDRPLYGHYGASTQLWVGSYLEGNTGRRWFVAQVRLGIDPDNALLIRRNLPVYARDRRRIGCVRQWKIDNQQRITQLVIRRGSVLPVDQTVTVAQVQRIGEQGVELKLDAATLKQKPPRPRSSNRALPPSATHNRS